jgi:L-ribulose-5-phosphate 4-epimerase
MKNDTELHRKVLTANLLLPKYDLVTFTWGNVSGIDRTNNIVAIKPSGVEYETMTVNDIVTLTLNNEIISGNLNPSSDTQTHLELYKAYLNIGGICHTHSRYATSFAQAGRKIPVLGTTHADDFFGDIPLARSLTTTEIEKEYERAIAMSIIDTDFNPDKIPAILVPKHGVFTFGKTPLEAVRNAKILEEVALMAFNTLLLNSNTDGFADILLCKHYNRKHGRNAYYGQKK